MDTILITGGAGFIGSHFTHHVARRYPKARILLLDALTYAGNPENLSPELRADPRFEFWYGNVRNGELVDTLVGRSEVVVHFAAESHVARSIFDNLVFYETDVIGTQVVANAVLKHADHIDRFVHISTSEVYGSAEREPMDEEHPLKPRSPYASAKTGADRLVFSYATTYGIPAVIVRPFNNYGARQHLEKVIPRFITSALLEEPLTVHGTGGAARDWLYVEDHCEALGRLLEAPMSQLQAEVVNLGSGEPRTVLEIAQAILEMTGRPAELLQNIGDRPGQVSRQVSSTEKASRLLGGWKASTPFQEGLERTIRWYADNRGWWEGQRWMRAIPIRTRDGRIEMH